MALGMRLATRHAVIAASPEIRAALRVLAMSGGALEVFVAEHLESNPFLVERSRGAGASAIDLIAAPAPSLEALLFAQLAAAGLSPAERALGARLIAELDDDGYLRGEAFAFADANASRLLDVLRGFSPTGVFARDLADRLSMQLAARGRLDPIAVRVLAHLPCVVQGAAALAAAAGVSEEDASDVLSDLARLSPRLADDVAPPLPPPDVIVAPAPSGGWEVTLNADVAPRLALDDDYFTRVAAGAEGGDLAFATQAYGQARWLVRTLRQRARTLLRAAGEIVRRQDAFLREGRGRLCPLTMRTVGEALKLHPSTISRVVANKLAATPQGVIELRALFCGGLADDAAEVSSEAVRHRIKALIAREHAAPDVLSDAAITVALERDGVRLSRRTVAKYREAMQVGSSRQRRRALQAGARAGLSA